MRGQCPGRPGPGSETVRPRTGLERGSWRVTCLFVICKASHDGGVHDAVQEHGEGADREAGVVQVLLHHAVYLVVRQLHGLDGVLQGADLHLRKWRTEWHRASCRGPRPARASADASGSSPEDTHSEWGRLPTLHALFFPVASWSKGPSSPSREKPGILGSLCVSIDLSPHANSKGTTQGHRVLGNVCAHAHVRSSQGNTALSGT